MILITGASGNVGGEVLKQTLALGATVRAQYRDAKSAAAAPQQAEVAIADYNKLDELRSAMRGVEKLFLVCSPVPQLPQLESNVIEAAKLSGVKRIIKLSAIGAGTGAHTFAKWHQQVENKLRSSGLSWTLLRPNGFMQNVFSFAGTIKSQGAFYGSATDARCSFIDIRDVAAVAAKTLVTGGHEEKIYELTGPEALNYADLAQKISVATKRTVRYISVAEAAARQSMLDSGMPAWLADAILDLQHYYDAGNCGAVTNDVERVTGRKPITFAQFAKEFAKVFQPEAAAAS